MANVKVIQGGAVPLPTDVNQLGEALMGNADLGKLSLFGTVTDPVAPTVALNTTAGNLTGTYQYLVAIATGWKSSDGNLHINGFAPGSDSATVVCVGEMVNLSEIPTGPADSTNQYGSVARILYRYGVVTPPTTALSPSLVADSSSTLAATTYYVATAFGNTNGDTPVGSSQASIAIATANTDDIRFDVTVPSGATYAIVGLGTATGGESQYAKVSTTATVTFVGTNSAGLTATVSGGVLTITITAPQTDTSTAMPTTNTAYLVGSGYEFVAAIGDNTTTTWTDNLKDSSVGTGMPTSSSSPAWNGEAVTAAVPTVNSTGTTMDFNGPVTGTDFVATGIAGATASSRYAGATTGGAPTTGTFAVGDFVVDHAGAIWLCTVAGSPGTWKAVNPVVADPAEVELTTTTATTIFTYTPATSGRFALWMLARVVTAATTVTATLTYTSSSGAQTYTIWNAQSLAVTDNAAIPYYFQALAGDAITLTVTAGTANQVYIDATLEAK